MVSTSTLRILEPASNILAFYDGRIPNTRLFSQEANWLDDGAYALGIASYVVFDGNDALVFDTGISIAHATLVRKEIERRGVTSIQVVLSHHHRDHVAGTQAFEDCEILASRKTAAALEAARDRFAKGTPPIAPLVMPTNIFDGVKTLRTGAIDIELRPLDIHSFDGLTVYLPESRTLLAGDTLEDTVTYVDEPKRLGTHLAELDRLLTWDVAAILPAHGDPDRIAKGGYDMSFVEATRDYTEMLLQCRTDPVLATLPLQEFVARHIQNGSLIYYEAYETVHRENVRAVLAS